MKKQFKRCLISMFAAGVLLLTGCSKQEQEAETEKTE